MFEKLFRLTASLDGLISGKSKHNISNKRLVKIKCHKSKNIKINIVVYDQLFYAKYEGGVPVLKRD